MASLQDAIHYHRAHPEDEGFAQQLARALDRSGPVICDRAELWFQGVDGSARYIQLGRLRRARDVPALVDQGTTTTGDSR